MILMAVVAALSLIFMPGGFYLAVCFLTISLIWFLLWRNHRPGILPFAFSKQWVQVLAFVIWMDVVGFGINSFTTHGGIAILMSCLGLLVMAWIIALRIKDLPVPTLDQLRHAVSRFNEKKIFMLYLASALFLGGLTYALGGGGGFAQILGTLRTFKWVFFLLFGYVSWLNKKSRYLLVLMIAFEFISGLVSYFSDFKEVFLYTIILSFTFITRISFKQILYGLIITVFLGFVFITWTAVKADYRMYLNQGTKTQQVNVSKSQAFNKIGDQINALTVRDYQMASVLLLYRVQYILHLSLTMDRIPDQMPHEYGKVWWDNVTFVLMPRLLFPNKPIYEATVKTNKYTGLSYAGFEQGASFSLGYFADSFVDFGYLGMLFPLALLALYVAWMYRTFYKTRTLNIGFRLAIINVVLYEFTAFESDGLFLFGRLTLMFLIYWVASKTIFPRLQTWLYK